MPPDVVRAGQEFSDALTAAVLHGRAAEDDSQGHALFEDPATRVVQMRFAAYAARDVAQLRRVLRESADDAQRALAAQVLAYVSDKQSVVQDLVEAMDDPSADVRNNAMRSLAVFARMTPDRAHAAVRVPYEPFVQLLHSLLWTDRNKAAMALQGLSVNRDPLLLDLLRARALAPLVEMARWKSAGHAEAAFTVLGRIAGLSDEDIQAAWQGGDRERLLQRFAVPAHG